MASIWPEISPENFKRVLGRMMKREREVIEALLCWVPGRASPERKKGKKKKKREGPNIPAGPRFNFRAPCSSSSAESTVERRGGKKKGKGGGIALRSLGVFAGGTGPEGKGPRPP